MKKSNIKRILSGVFADVNGVLYRIYNTGIDR